MGLISNPYLVEIQDKAGSEIIKYVEDITGKQITISLKNKRGIIRKATEILNELYADELSKPNPVAEEATKMGLTIDQYIDFKANEEQETIMPPVELNVLDLRGVSRWAIARQHSQITKVSHGTLSVLFGSRKELAEQLFKSLNARREFDHYDEFIC